MECAPTFYPFSIFTFILVIESTKEFGGASLANSMLLMLSQQMTIKTSIDCPKSENNFCNQITSHVAIVVLLYSTSLLDSEIVGYFLLLQLTTPFPKENMKPLVDLLFETLLTHITSMYPCICN
jgi:hypothetical protein